MPRLRLREVAEAQGVNMSQLQRRSGVTIPSVRRYWYNTRNGSAEGPILREIDMVVLAAMAKVLGVKTGELIEDTDEATEATEPTDTQPKRRAATARQQAAQRIAVQ